MEEQSLAESFMVLALALGVHLFPTVIAFMRGMYGKWGVLILNLFFGWTGLGWIGALIWSAAGRK